MAAIEKFNEANLQAICDILGDTGSGLTGSEIGKYLRECSCPDPIPDMTKRHRLFAGLAAKQNADGYANGVLAFVKHAMNPVRHVGNKDYFETQRGKLNGVLAFSGLTLGEDGHLRMVKAAQTLTDAEAAASVLRKALIERKVHPDVLKFCRAELVVDNYFHAVFEAAKSVAEKLREKTGLTGDGAGLVDGALGIGQAGHPRLAFNSLQSESERSEHTGLSNLTKGLFRRVPQYDRARAENSLEHLGTGRARHPDDDLTRASPSRRGHPDACSVRPRSPADMMVAE